MNKENIKIGLVIPVYLTKFVKETVENILNSNNRDDLVLCIVNDGRDDVQKYLAEQDWSDNIEIINLSENRCFSGANNVGWKYLINKYPNIEYLGSINDDTIPRNGWLDKLIGCLKKYPKTALAMPIMATNQGFLGTKKNYATWRLKGSDEMEPVYHRIESDSFVSAVNGFCFVVLKDVLIEIGFLDEKFKNGCEDLDLGIKLLLKGWRMVVAKNSYVYHIGGASRYTKGSQENLDRNHKILADKYDGNIAKYNNLNNKGFLIK